MKAVLGRADLDRLAQIVRDETGNQVQEKNFSMLSSRLQSRMLRLGLASIEDYWSYFEEHEDEEREVLQSLMTTHYTFFFREYAHFDTLQDWIEREKPRLLERFQKEKRPVRVWSAACSRGHEVYSLAAFLTVHLTKRYGIPFEVVGTDIDVESIAFAKNGVYPIKEVNTIPQAFLHGYWKKGTGAIKEFAAAHPSVRTQVRFEPLNLLEVDGWQQKAAFDVVFCRNVFIYFSDENVRKIATSIARRIEPGGIFVSGLSEPIRFEAWKFPSIGPSAYQIGSASASASASAAATVAVSVKPTSVSRPAPAPVSAPVAASVKRYRVLCVDDSTTIQALIKQIFKQDPNCEGVDTALNGREARERLNKGKYQLITLDIHMPEVNGIEFLEHHYKKLSDPPVLMVSSVNRADIDLANKALTLGAFDYVEKPAMNNLKKCAQEILTKTKMALRTSPAMDVAPVETTGEFDNEIKQKIIVPDASQCVRFVIADRSSLPSLKEIVRGQKAEMRSPPLVIFWNGQGDDTNIEEEVLGWTDLPVAEVRDFKQVLRPNRVYVCRAEPGAKLLEDLKVKSASLQILAPKVTDLRTLGARMQLQTLVDEPLAKEMAKIESVTGLKVSDVTPATSFPSLSVEYFANVRKAG